MAGGLFGIFNKKKSKEEIEKEKKEKEKEDIEKARNDNPHSKQASSAKVFKGQV